MEVRTGLTDDNNEERSPLDKMPMVQPHPKPSRDESMTTPREIQDSPRSAGLAKRFKAFAFDYLIIVSYIVVLAGVTMVVVKTAGFIGLSLRWPEDPFLADLVAFITLILPVVLYFALQESSPKQATWGKRRVGIRVVNANNGALTRKQSFVRSLVKLLPWQIAHTCIFQMGGFTSAPEEPSPVLIAGFTLAYLLAVIFIASALISKKHRTPYDLVAGAHVVVAK